MSRKTGKPSYVRQADQSARPPRSARGHHRRHRDRRAGRRPRRLSCRTSRRDHPRDRRHQGAGGQARPSTRSATLTEVARRLAGDADHPADRVRRRRERPEPVDAATVAELAADAHRAWSPRTPTARPARPRPTSRAAASAARSPTSRSRSTSTRPRRAGPAERSGQPRRRSPAAPAPPPRPSWSVAAAQLDQINVDAGFGHQHVYLQTEQGSGAFTADGEEEGHTGG